MPKQDNQSIYAALDKGKEANKELNQISMTTQQERESLIYPEIKNTGMEFVELRHELIDLKNRVDSALSLIKGAECAASPDTVEVVEEMNKSFSLFDKQPESKLSSKEPEEAQPSVENKIMPE